MAYSSELCGSKLRSKLGSTLNESAAAPVSSFARRQLEKMGWRDGDGLGKSRHGMSTHVRVHKRTDEEGGLGREKIKAREAADTWWTDSVGDTLARLQQAQSQSKGENDKKKKKRRKKGAEKAVSDDSSDRGGAVDYTNGARGRIVASAGVVRRYTDEELFVATGGARFGMRAQRRAVGKWTRTEGGDEVSRLEEEARRKMEWTGRGKARVIIGAGSTITETVLESTTTKVRLEEAAVLDERGSGTESSPLPSSLPSSSSSDEDGEHISKKKRSARVDKTDDEGDAPLTPEKADNIPFASVPTKEDEVTSRRKRKKDKKKKKKKRKKKDERRAERGGDRCNVDAVGGKESESERKKRKREQTVKRTE